MASGSNSVRSPLYAGIDAGGTSWKLVIASGPDDIRTEARVPTTSPRETLVGVSSWLQAAREAGYAVDAIGIASFGPIIRDPDSPRWGEMLGTPKAGWQGSNARRTLQAKLDTPCALETDVNAALLAEAEWGRARGLRNAVYVTIGTGVGCAIMIEGKVGFGAVSPEFGHLRLARTSDTLDRFRGSCPYHGDCLEGVLSASSLRAEWGADPSELDDDDPRWDDVADRLGALCVSLRYAYMPDRIILGGGLMARQMLIRRAAASFERQLCGYCPVEESVEDYIVSPGLGGRAGALGGVLLAQWLTANTAAAD